MNQTTALPAIRSESHLGPRKDSLSEKEGQINQKLQTGRQCGLPSTSLLLVPEIGGSKYPTLEDLLGGTADLSGVQKKAEALLHKASEGVVLGSRQGAVVTKRIEGNQALATDPANPQTGHVQVTHCAISKIVSVPRPTTIEQFLHFVESSLDWIEALAIRMKTDLRITATSTWDFAIQCFQVFVFVVLRYLLRAVKVLYIGHFLCLLGLGSTYAAVVAEIEGKTGEVGSSLGENETEKQGAEGSSVVSRKGLLPAQLPKDKDKLTVVLDLDETLVCAYNSAGLPSSIHQHAAQNGVKWFQLQCTANEKDENGNPKVNLVTVYERPGLSEFLRRASAIGELVLFTAGLEGYARPLVDRIDPEGIITARLYRPATVSTKYREHVKDLSALGRDLRRTVLVDNNPFSFILQPANGIPCVPFTGEQPEDRQLLEVLLPLLESLSKQPDIRPVLLDRYRMPSWFKMRGFAPPENELSETESLEIQRAL